MTKHFVKAIKSNVINSNLKQISADLRLKMGGGGVSPAVNPAFVSLLHFVFIPHFVFYHSLVFHFSLNTQKIQFTLKNAFNPLSLRAFVRKFSVSSLRANFVKICVAIQKFNHNLIYLWIAAKSCRLLAMTRIFIKNSTHFILFTPNFRAVCTDKF